LRFSTSKDAPPPQFPASLGLHPHLFFFRDWVKKFQFVQERYDLIKVNIVVFDENENILDTHKDEVCEIENRIGLVMGPACRVQWDFLSDIPPTASGKYRYTISKVPR
jgi:phenylacetate-CoA ligase